MIGGRRDVDHVFLGLDDDLYPPLSGAPQDHPTNAEYDNHEANPYEPPIDPGKDLT